MYFLKSAKKHQFFKTAHPTVPADIWCQVWCNLDGSPAHKCKYNIKTKIK